MADDASDPVSKEVSNLVTRLETPGKNNLDDVKKAMEPVRDTLNALKDAEKNPSAGDVPFKARDTADFHRVGGGPIDVASDFHRVGGGAIDVSSDYKKPMETPVVAKTPEAKTPPR